MPTLRIPSLRARLRRLLGSGNFLLIARLLSDQGAKHWRGYAFATVMTVIVAATTTLSAWIMKDVINEIFVAKKLAAVWIFGAAIVAIYAVKGFSTYGQTVVLARVAKNRIRDRQAYQFFVRLDQSRKAHWTKDINARGPVFQFPGHCQRSDVVYNPLLKVYLLALGYNHRGGWGIFDAPEPWGPWTTVYHTDNWGLGTHGYRLPAKWIGPDSTSMTLVFSGIDTPKTILDAFCVRQMKLELRDPHARARENARRATDVDKQ